MKYATPTETAVRTNPTQVRNVFGDNLRLLLKNAPPVRQICSDIGLHRSQFNRFLNGEAFPKPDTLQRLCTYFGVDARILLEPLKPNRASEHSASVTLHPEIASYLQIAGGEADTAAMPSGFYLYARQSYQDPQRFQTAVNYVYVAGGQKYIKGFMNRDLARELGIPTTSTRDREFRGPILAMNTGVAFFAAHHGARSFTVNFLERRQVGARWLLVGHCMRTIGATGGHLPVGPIVFQPLQADLSVVLPAARSAGFVDLDALPSVVRAIFRSA